MKFARVRNFFRSAIARIANIFWQRERVTAVAQLPKPKRVKGEVHERGAFYFREAILDDLEDYFLCMRKLRKADPEGYRTYSNLGVSFTPHSGRVFSEVLEPRWRDGSARPGLGAVALLRTENADDDDLIPVKLAYFQHMKRPRPTVQMTDGDVYAVTVFFTRNGVKGLKFGVPCEYHVAVKKDGTIQVLKELHRKYLPSTAKMASKKWTRQHRPARSVPTISFIPQCAWDYPSWMKSWKKDPNRKHWKTTQEAGAKMFSMLLSGYEAANSDVRVRVKKNGIVATFSVDMLRTPYFFADRDVTLNDAGSRKRIFHIVRTHRRMRGGVETYVKSHFRGERRFVWNGYEVNVTMPGLHHNSSVEFDVGGYDVDNQPLERGKWLTLPQVGAKLDAHMNV